MAITSFLSGLFGRSSQTPPASKILAHSPTKNVDLPPDVRRILRQRQYCKILARSCDLPFDELSIRVAWEILRQEMAWVPPGSVALAPTGRTGEEQVVELAAFYIDRFCVTNADYAHFVESGGYETATLWPESILTDLLKFTDLTGVPGPRFWSGGKPPKDRLDHPVVGICWFEAFAYSRWAGKRLPSPGQWQRAGTWGLGAGGNECRYPWGNSFDQERANLWNSRLARTVPVHRYKEGATPNGVCQLIGNTWEWINAPFSAMPNSQSPKQAGDILAEIRGGAFDTYFSSQATCQFRTGQPLLMRAANIGFRCCADCSDLVDRPENPTAPGEK